MRVTPDNATQHVEQTDVYFRLVGDRPEQVKNIKTSYFRKAIFEKRLPRYKLGRAVYLKLSDVIALLESGRTQ